MKWSFFLSFCSLSFQLEDKTVIVQCEQCKTKFRLDDEKIKEKGVKAKCSQCQNVFTIQKPPNPAGEPFKQSEKNKESVDILAPDFEEGSLVPERKFPLRSALIVLALLFLAGVCFLFWDELMGNSDIVFSLPHTQGYYLDNSKADKMFVVEGRAINNSSREKSFIKVKSTLLDSMGNEIIKKEAYCGNIFSQEELMRLEPDQINSRLNHSEGESSVNINLPPKKSIPFMIVFFDLPEDIKEFTVAPSDAEKTIK